MKLTKIIRGGFMAGQRTYLISGVGILSAVAAYLVGDINIFEAMNSIYPLAGIYFLRRGMEKNKGNKNANSRKISK